MGVGCVVVVSRTLLTGVESLQGFIEWGGGGGGGVFAPPCHTIGPPWQFWGNLLRCKHTQQLCLFYFMYQFK